MDGAFIHFNNCPREEATMTEKKLTATDEAIHEEIYPLLAEIEDRLGKKIALALWINLTRKLATRGHSLDELQQLLDKHHTHQTEFNTRQAKKSMN
jgi:hypothetical protein